MRPANAYRQRQSRDYWVYILTNRSYTSLYTGVTSNIQERMRQHKTGALDGFTKRYRTHLLIYCEWTDDVWAALQREKQIKGWSREKKIELIESVNPSWYDLSEVRSHPAPTRSFLPSG